MWRIVEIIQEIFYSFHQAILYGLEMLYLFWTSKLNTPMLTSPTTHKNNDFIINLIRKGYNINTADEFGHTPLHVAISVRFRIEVVHELIKSGADINAQDRGKQTPLRHAVRHDNVEAVCMLLYYNADVNLVCEQGMTPFTYALYSFRLNIARILSDYYDDFTNQKCHKVTSLHVAVAHDKDLAMHLLNNGADVNSITHDGQSLLDYSLHYDHAYLFKYILSRMDHRALLHTSRSFLLEYITNCYFVAPDWLEGLYLLLESPAAFKLAQLCNNWMGSDKISRSTFFLELTEVFHEKKIKSKDRLSIIYICLSFGIQATVNDIYTMYTKYGFNEELEALIDSAIVTKWDGKQLPLAEGYNVMMPALILGIEPDLSANAIYKILINLILSSRSVATYLLAEKSLFNFLKFFSMSSEVRKLVAVLLQDKIVSPKFADRFTLVESRTSDVPTLLELCRKSTRKFIKLAYQVKQPYQFHNAIRNLNAPPLIRDILRFKRTIY